MIACIYNIHRLSYDFKLQRLYRNTFISKSPSTLIQPCFNIGWFKEDIFMYPFG